MAADPERSRWWELEHSWWLALIAVGFGFLTWAGFAYVALRTRRKRWFAWAAGYLVLIVVSTYLPTGPVAARCRRLRALRLLGRRLRPRARDPRRGPRPAQPRRGSAPKAGAPPAQLSRRRGPNRIGQSRAGARSGYRRRRGGVRRPRRRQRRKCGRIRAATRNQP